MLLQFAQRGEVVQLDRAFGQEFTQSPIEGEAPLVQRCEVAGDQVRQQRWKAQRSQVLLVFGQAVEVAVLNAGGNLCNGARQLVIEREQRCLEGEQGLAFTAQQDALQVAF
jgi:hypothetical protein